VIEGRIARIEVRGNRRFRDYYFHQRLERVAEAPVRVTEIEHALRVLQRDVWIERIDAEIEPGDRFGESRLVVMVTEATQWKASVEANNERSPAIGSAGGVFEGRVANLTGLGDVWTARFHGTEGSIDFEGRVEMPVTPWDTRIRLRARVTETELQESPFDSLDIESSARTYGVSVLQPVYRSEADEVWVELAGEWRQTKSTILGEDFCFELQTRDCARPRVAVLRTSMQWSHRTRHDAIAARALFSFGLDALNATTGGPDSAPDGEFFAWLGQAQWAHVFPEDWRALQLLLRVDAQLADDPLLSMEQIAVGGRRSVRGYRENQLVRDNAVILSGEVRFPVLRDSLRRPLVELVPFMDWARAWNHGSGSPTDTLWSIGTGLRLSLLEGVLGEVYWGGRLKDVSNPHDYLQDYGVHMRLRIDAPDIF
jgi:hemolysin activation/secretion protein